MSTRPGKDDGHVRVEIARLPTGVPGLDEILGGGLPEYSFNIIAGAPGSGKTTLAHQLMFANANKDRPALYFTVLGEPAIKMLRYQQQFSFFDMTKIDGAIRFVNLSQVVLENDLGAVLDAIVKEVENAYAGIVVVDSFRTVVRRAHAMGGRIGAFELELQGFVQRLALHLTSWQATTFLIGEYDESELRDNPVFTVADGLLWLSQNVERNSIIRKLQVMKMRGQASMPGLHTFRITDDGLQTFPRTFGLNEEKDGRVKGTRRLSTGIAKLDGMLHGGIPEGESVLLVGPTGSGKSTLGMQFIAEGLKQGEPGIVAVFEELPAEYVQRAAMLGIDFAASQRDGTLKIISLRPLDLSVEETVHEIVNTIRTIGAKRLVIDSLMGFEMALAPGFREDFRESQYRMFAALIRLGLTIVTTVEVADDITSFNLTNVTVSFLADDILRMRYVPINGQLRKILMVLKMRRSQHSIDMHEYQITSAGLDIGEPLRGNRGLISGIPETWSPDSGQNEPELKADRPAATKKESLPPPPKRGKRGRRRK
jgi:circadian clock protein KaiC